MEISLESKNNFYDQNSGLHKKSADPARKISPIVSDEKLNFYEKGDSFRYLLQRLLPKATEKGEYAAAFYAAAY